jgi:hypothetical protein
VQALEIQLRLSVSFLEDLEKDLPMAYWNKVFVEGPLETFNPVKTVDDLLRENHLP